ncbi:MAG TPA: 23S rRNA (pseudouridine(1915)-N(3))-methyltransferase RlmH [Alphaproteobacteria bacterium]|jgi:23S rRNA (pseudouridine1915-N3)-methyltransferase|nr:23S rRNA (pseudouridine(1915)-N(3))-methyltransferase RlmH [Alphaproteobacteria bacterium]
MRIVIAAVGKFRREPERELYDAFVKRITWPVALKEVEERSPLPAPKRKASEARKLLAAVPDGATLIALDEAGNALTSAAFARQIGRWRDDGIGELAFAIGGADGLDASVLGRAQLTLSLGPMTWPHMMVRALLAEQLYRAQSILAGHPYHRG